MLGWNFKIYVVVVGAAAAVGHEEGLGESQQGSWVAITWAFFLNGGLLWTTCCSLNRRDAER